MELIRGGSLKTLIQEKKDSHFSDSESSYIIRCILEAVEHVHSKTYVHRDMKPENILLDYDKDRNMIIKLADFGLSA